MLEKYKFVLIIIIILVFVTLLTDDSTNEVLILASENNSEEQIVAISPGEIFVQITGAVAKPGVYQMNSGDRIKDLFDEAEVTNFNQKCVNLAQKLVDEQNIYVPESGEQCPSEQSIVDGIVNINSASSLELQTISGIGEAKADSIVEYRDQNGSFETKEELLSVEGISENLLLSIAEQISLS